MANINSIYPSKYISASDLDDTPKLATIKDMTFESMTDGENKPCLWFAEFDKGLILNKTNAKTIAGFLGDETDAWVDRQIVMIPTVVDYAGKSVDAIRVRAPKNRAATPQATAMASQAPVNAYAPPAGHPASMPDLNDEAF